MVQARIDSFGTSPEIFTHNLLPVSTRVPIESYILHKDNKEFTRLQFDRQTTELAGSIEDVGSTIASGLRSISAGLESSFDALGTSMDAMRSSLYSIDSSLEDISTELFGINGTLQDGFVAVTHGLQDINIAIRSSSREIVDRLGRLESQLSANLSGIHHVLTNPERTWSEEQANEAWDAFRVGEYATSEQKINLAIEGLGTTHPGVKNNPDLYLQRAEVQLANANLDRIGRSRASLSLAESYLRIHRDQYSSCRLAYNCAYADIKEHRLTGKLSLLDSASNWFKLAEQHNAFQVLARIGRARAILKAGNIAEAKSLLVELLTRNPRAFLHLSVKDEERLPKDFVSEVLETVKKAILGDGARHKQLSKRAAGLHAVTKTLEVSSPKLKSDALEVLRAIEDVRPQYFELASRGERYYNAGTFFSAIRYKDIVDFAPKLDELFQRVKAMVERKMR